MTSALTPVDVFPPGEYLRDELEERGWTAKEFAEIIDRPVQVVSEILNGRKQIMPQTALAIAEALGTSAELWTNLQNRFNLFEAKRGRPPITDVSRRAQLRSIIPISELRARGWLPDTEDPSVLETSVKELLGITDLTIEPKFAIAARRANATSPFSSKQIAWVAQLRRLASSRKVAPFQVGQIAPFAKDLVHRIHDPAELGMLREWLADVGVVLINLLPLKSSGLDGAATILDDGTPVIGLTSRNNRMDSYIFTLLHELAHISLGHLEPGTAKIDEELERAEEVDDEESAANRQAGNWVLPEEFEFSKDRPTMIDIIEISHRYRIHPSLVIGRIQRDRGEWGFYRGYIPRVRSQIVVET